MGFVMDDGLTFIGVLTKCSPNLEKIKIEIEPDDEYDELDSVQLQEFSVILENYYDARLEHLKELEVDAFRNLELEVGLVKFILARSPNLKKVIFRPCSSWIFDRNEGLEIVRALLQATNTPPVELIVEML